MAAGVGGAGNDEEVLDGGRIGREAEVAGDRRDPPGERDVALGHTRPIVGKGDDAKGHPAGPDVDRGRVVVDPVQPGDGQREPRARFERPGREEREGALAQDPPVLDPRRLLELARADPVGGHGVLRSGLVRLNPTGRSGATRRHPACRSHRRSGRRRG